MKQSEDFPNTLLNWLLESSNPSMRYRTLTELLDRPLKSPEVQDTKNAINISHPVQTIISQMHPNGYWLQKNPRTGQIFGKGVEYGAFATTHYCLSYLAELGVDKTHPKIARAADRYLNLQQPDGDYYRHFSCLIGLNIRTFLLLGYTKDSRVQKSIELLLNTDRADGGYLCDMHEGKYKTKPVKSCVRGSAKALLAFSYLPQYWQHPRVQQLISYFLDRNGIFKRNNANEYVNKDIQRFSFPIAWRVNLFEILYALSTMGYGSDQRLHHAWKLLDTKRDVEGRYILDWTPIQSPWKMGKRGSPNKWITFYALLAKKQRDNFDKNTLKFD